MRAGRLPIELGYAISLDQIGHFTLLGMLYPSSPRLGDTQLSKLDSEMCYGEVKTPNVDVDVEYIGFGTSVVDIDNARAFCMICSACFLGSCYAISCC